MFSAESRNDSRKADLWSSKVLEPSKALESLGSLICGTVISSSSPVSESCVETGRMALDGWPLLRLVDDGLEIPSKSENCAISVNSG